MAVSRIAALELGVPLYEYLGTIAKISEYVLPVPAFNVINGGKHGGNNLSTQEFMVLPIGAKSFREALQMGVEVYHNLKTIIKKKYGITAINVGDEGGFAPPLTKSSEALEFLVDAVAASGYQSQIKLGLDVAATEFYSKEAKRYNFEGKSLSSEEMIQTYEDFVQRFPITSIEDPLEEDAFDQWAVLNGKIGKNLQIVGDDLLVTNLKRIQKGISQKACNALLLKVNQIGTVTESIRAAKLSQKNSWGVMVSHRSGETEDTFIADLAVGIKSGQIKSGAPARSERLAKYNQLLRIEEELGPEARFAQLPKF